MPPPFLATQITGTQAFTFSRANASAKFTTIVASTLAAPITTSGPTPDVLTALTPSQSIALTLTPPSGALLDRVVVWATYRDRAPEFVFSLDDGFSSLFGASSYAAGVLTVKRVGGWPSAPTLKVHANSSLGGVN